MAIVNHKSHFKQFSLVQIKRFFGLHSFPTNALSLSCLSSFHSRIYFLKVVILGYKTFKDLYIDKAFASFLQVSDKL